MVRDVSLSLNMTTAKAVIAVALLCLAGPVYAQSMFRGDAAHSGTSKETAPRQFHRVKWKFPTGDRILSSPVWDNKVVYFGGDDGNIYAVDSETGRQIWKRATGGPTPCTPAVANGTLFATSYDGKFYALNAQTGAIKWKFATEGERRFEAKGIHGLQPKNQTIADQFDV
ncbi:MAG: eukaryotic-like serine/threonine-protein kinase, partial [Verrucomicrobiota bacterium]